MNRTVIAGVLTALISLWCAPAHSGGAAGTNGVSIANRQPLWEIGVAGFGARLPYYRGSDDYRTYAFPLPYFVYRGERLQADREGVRGLFYKGRWLETDLSMSGNPPVNDGTGARHGMPGLDPLIEIGPALRVFLYRGACVKSVYLEGAVRAVSSIDTHELSPSYEGVRGGVGLVVTGVKPGSKSPWTVGGRLGLDVADRDYHRYFYDVDEQYVLPDRPTYQSDGGYSGATLSGWVSRRITDAVMVSVFAKGDSIEGAVYEDSPLVRSRYNVTVGAMLVWKMAESKTKAKGK